ncbi:MAG: dienelactone hydrolase family protein [Acidimicrobiia bacterium]
MSREVAIDLDDGIRLLATDGGPAAAETVVVFAHGSGSSRHSARNRQVAERLQRDGSRTLLLDLLTPDEEEVDLRSMQHRFDIPLLGHRVTGAVDWLMRRQEVTLGLFGASTGAAAALVAAASRPDEVAAVVSRGGRPDLASDALRLVHAPTLLIVGGEDLTVLDLNQQAQAALVCPNRLEIIPGATHLFEEPGKLEVVADLAADWFSRYLTP